MSLSFLAENSSVLTNATLDEMSSAIAESANVAPELVEVSVDEVAEEVTEEVIEGNLTLAAELSDINAEELAAGLADAWNISEAGLEIELLAASVQLIYSVRLPNCSAEVAAYDDACGTEAAVAADYAEGGAPGLAAQRLQAVIESVDAEEMSSRLRVPVTATTTPRRRVQRYRLHATRIKVRIRSLGNTTDAADKAARQAPAAC